MRPYVTAWGEFLKKCFKINSWRKDRQTDVQTDFDKIKHVYLAFDSVSDLDIAKSAEKCLFFFEWRNGHKDRRTNPRTDRLIQCRKDAPKHEHEREHEEPLASKQQDKPQTNIQIEQTNKPTEG